jgi:hypothetical protein
VLGGVHVCIMDAGREDARWVRVRGTTNGCEEESSDRRNPRGEVGLGGTFDDCDLSVGMWNVWAFCKVCF